MAEAITNTTGEENVEHDYSHKLADDCLSNKVMAEIARRLQSNVAFNDGGQVVFAPDPPNSKERIWIETNSTGSIIGTVKRYDSATSTWTDDHYDPSDDPNAVPFDNPVLNRVVQKYDPVSAQAITTNQRAIVGSNFNYTPREADSFIEYRFACGAFADPDDTTHKEMICDFTMWLEGVEQELSEKAYMFGSDSFRGAGMMVYSHILESWGKTAGYLEVQGVSQDAQTTSLIHQATSGGALTQAHVTITEYGK